MHLGDTTRIIAAAAAVGAATLLAAPHQVAAAAPAGATVVYTMTNAAATQGGNAVLAFRSDRGGRLTQIGSFPTGESGTGSPLGSQGALAVAGGGSRLLVVNAGSNSVSLFAIGHGGWLRLVDTAPSGGALPNSVTVHGHLVYVLNSGSNTVSALRLDAALAPIPHSTRALSPGASGPVQIGFTPDGDHLVVTEKASDTIDTLPVGAGGRAGAARSTQLATGMTPFGFDFARDGRLIVSNAEAGGTDASSVSSFTVGAHGALRHARTVADGQTAACWLVSDGAAGTAYVANAGSGTVSAYRVGAGGVLRLLASAAATTGGHPVDETVSGGELFVLISPGGEIADAAVRTSGMLGAPHIGASGLSGAATGLVSATV